MWGDFKPGSGAISIVRDGGSDGSTKGYHQVLVTGLSATWSNGGGTSSADITLESDLDVGLDGDFTGNDDPDSDGSKDKFRTTAI